MDGPSGDEKAAHTSAKKSLGGHYVGEVLAGTYRIARRVGSGGMADVYEVEHLRLGSRFAAKILRPREGEEPSVRRFVREARLLASLKNEHIVTVFDVSGPDEEAPFYVMELLNGQDLRKLLATTPELSVSRAVKIISDACLGISAAHAAGLVHRDLKPENLFVTHRASGEEICKLLDFGVAKADGGTSTEHGALIGTVRYMAPEQIAHAGTVSPRADVRGLGAILYECLAGRPPHVADSLERLLFQVLNDPIASIREHRAEIPPELDDVVLRALERDPASRYPSAQAFAEALRPFAGGSVGGGTVEATARTPSDGTVRLATERGGVRRPMLLGAFAGAAAALVASFLVWGGAHSTDAVGAAPTRTPESPPGSRAREMEQTVVARVEVPQTAAVAPEMPSSPIVQSASNVSPTKPTAQKTVRRPAAAPSETSPRSNPEETAATPRVRIESQNPYGPDVGTARFGANE
ncbi:MAG TPA: protein kinase [Polyangiaceae bacterium]